MNGYTDYNALIIKSAELTAIQKCSIDHGWYHHSKYSLKPVMDYRNDILQHIQTDKSSPSKQTVRLLRSIQHKVDEAIVMAKTALYLYLARVIHDMPFHSKDAWQNIKRSCGG